MFSRHNRMIGLMYGLADAALVLVSFWLAYLVRLNLNVIRPLYPVSYYFIPLVIAIWLGVGIVLGVYRDILEEDLRQALLRPLKVWVISSLVLFALVFLLKLPYISRSLLALFVVIEFVLAALFRLAASQYTGRLRTSRAGCRHFLLVGGAPDAIEIAREIEANEQRGMRLSGFALVVPERGPAQSMSQLRGKYPVYAVSQLPELLHRRVIDEVIFAVSKDELDRLEETFRVCEQEGVRTRLSLSFLPHTISRVSLDRLREMPLLTFSTTPESEVLMLVKRVIDFVMAAAFVVILSPLLLLLTVLIKLTSQGPVLYRQTRCGLGGRKFTVYKFRSMRQDAEVLKEELEALNEVDGPVFKIKNDPRCTALGRFMRRLSLDELPQLFNILKGDMSFVGPRPPLPEEVEKYERWQRRRLRMQPGLTCLWAIQGRSRLNFKKWMELDLEYIDHWSPALDWKILLKTIPAVLLGRGAF